MAASDNGNSDANRRDTCFIATQMGKRFCSSEGTHSHAKPEDEGGFSATLVAANAPSLFLKTLMANAASHILFITAILRWYHQLDAMQIYVETTNVFKAEKSVRSTANRRGHPSRLYDAVKPRFGHPLHTDEPTGRCCSEDPQRDCFR